MSEKAKRLLFGGQTAHIGRRLTALIVSILAMGLSIAVFEMISFGTDPCSAMNLGISRLTGISFGSVQLLLNAALLLIVIKVNPAKIGIGTVLNMVCIGYIADFFMGVFDSVPALGTLAFSTRILIFVPTMFMFLMGASFYTVVDMGVAPYDAMPQIIAAHGRGHSFRNVRMGWDVGALVIGYALGSTIGLVTLVTGFCMGPAIAGVAKLVSGWFDETEEGAKDGHIGIPESAN